MTQIITPGFASTSFISSFFSVGIGIHARGARALRGLSEFILLMQYIQNQKLSSCIY